MSTSKTRSQYAFLEVKRSQASPCVALSGPLNVIGNILSAGFHVTTNIVACEHSVVGTGMELKLTSVRDTGNWTFLKSALLEEVLKCGFKPLSSVTDDLLVFSREVSL